MMTRNQRPRRAIRQYQGQALADADTLIVEPTLVEGLDDYRDVTDAMALADIKERMAKGADRADSWYLAGLGLQQWALVR